MRQLTDQVDFGKGLHVVDEINVCGQVVGVDEVREPGGVDVESERGTVSIVLLVEFSNHPICQSFNIFWAGIFINDR